MFPAKIDRESAIALNLPDGTLSDLLGIPCKLSEEFDLD